MEQEDAEFLARLLAEGADPDEVFSNMTLLTHAIDTEGDGALQTGEPLTVHTTAVLLAFGADPELAAPGGRTPVEQASRYGHHLALDLLRAHMGGRVGGSEARRASQGVHRGQDLVAFLEARLDEEADLARRCDGDGCGRWSAHGHTVDFCQAELAGFHPTIASHVALHDPARVLREVEAKRRVLARHDLAPAVGDPETPWDDRDDCRFDGDPWPCDDLLDLASPYADHPDFPRSA
ncbi:DUF6221 family protein [Streptomyces sp. NPDC056400]|uniref:DUF6221 family protein n=1 Tax=Streptomyces sp. NPDC056400 TaxID=3345808 RepID=UPI0035D89B60